MNRKAFIILLIFLGNILVFPIPVVQVHGADGSVTPADAIYYMKLDDQYPVNFTTRGAGSWDYYGSEDEVMADAFYLFGGSGWDYSVSQFKQMWEGDNSGGQTTYNLYIWEYSTQGNAGDYLNSSAEFHDYSYNGQVTYSHSLDLDFTASTDRVFIGWYIDTVASCGWTAGVWHETVLQNRYNWFYDDMNYPDALPDPFTGETTSSGRILGLRVDLEGSYTNQTTVNEYWGNSTTYTARRDLTYVFNNTLPDGQTPTVLDKSITVIYPKTEALVNVSYPTGGVYNQSIPLSSLTYGDYNTTHRYVEIDKTALDSYGDQLQVWTETNNYQYVFDSPIYENGTLTGFPVLVYAHTLGGTEEVNCSDGGLIYGTDIEVIMFSWEVDGIPRLFYVPEETETIQVTIPSGDFGVYGFSIRDYSGRIGDSDSYLEALRIINGTNTIITRSLIWNTQTNTPLMLEDNAVYFLRILLGTGSYYDIGYFTPISGQTPPELIVKGLDFDEQYQPVGAYINITIDRPNSTHIRAIYDDNLEAYSTLNITLEIELRNGTLVYTDYTTAENHTFNWYSAVNTTDYRVIVTVDHAYYGEIVESVILSGAWSPPTPLDFSFLGLTSSLLSTFIVLVFLGGVSRKSASLGLFTATIVGIALDTWGWWTMPVTIQASGLILAVLMRLTGRG